MASEAEDLAYRVFEVGSVVSLVGFLGGLIFGVYYLFA